MHTSFARSVKAAVIAGFLGLSIPASGAIVADTFNRATNNSLGLTSDATQTWVETEPSAERISIDTDGVNQVAHFNSRGSGTDPYAAVGISAKDVEVKVLMQGWQAPASNYFGGLLYRLSGTSGGGFANPAPAGYRVMLTTGDWNGSTAPANSIGLYWGNTFLANYVHGSALNNSQYYELKVVALGDNHKVYLDGVQVIDYTDANPAHNVAGAAGLGTYYGNWDYRNFEVNAAEVPEPASALLVLPAVALFARRRGNS